MGRVKPVSARMLRWPVRRESTNLRSVAALEGVMERRLAAILAGDVVGYSRLVQADEAGTVVALKARRTTILEPLTARHRGRIVKLMGDGVLMEFASAVNAVECAVELQAAMGAAN